MEITENRNAITATYDPEEWGPLSPEVLNLKAAAQLFANHDCFKNSFYRALKAQMPGFVTDSHNSGVLADLYRWAIGDGSGPLDPLKGIWIHGDPGCGKTTISNALISFIKTIRAYNRMLPDGRIECTPYNERRICSFTATEAIETLHCKSDARFDCSHADVVEIDDLTAEAMKIPFAEMELRILPWLLDRRCDQLRAGGFVRPTVVTCNFPVFELPGFMPGMVGKLCRSFNFVRLQGPMRGNIDPIYEELI